MEKYFKYDVDGIKKIFFDVTKVGQKVKDLSRDISLMDGSLSERFKDSKKIDYEVEKEEFNKLADSLRNSSATINSLRDKFVSSCIAFSIQSHKKTFSEDVTDAFEGYAEVEPAVISVIEKCNDVLKNIRRSLVIVRKKGGSPANY